MADTPKIRFKGFMEAWKQRKLGTIISEKLSNGVINKSGTQFSNVKHINVINMYTPDKIHTDDLTPSSHDENIIYKCNVEVGDIFMTRSSLKPEGIAEANVLLDPGRYVFDDHLIRMKVDKSKYDPIFVKINFRNKMIKTQFVMKSKTTAFTTIGQEDILECDGMFPLFDEQTKIGKFFQKLENLITLHQHKCDETIELKKYMLQKMFPKNGQKIPEIRFVGFTEDWEQRKLGDLSSSFEYGLNAAAKEYDGKNKYIRITDIDDDSREFMQNDVTSPDTDLSKAENYKLSEGDILFARTGASVGKSYIYRPSDGLVFYAGFLIRAKIKGDFNPEFVFQNTLTKAYEKFITVTSMRSGQPGVNAQEYSQFEIMVPSKNEQDKIAIYLRSLDHLITLHQSKCNELKEVKKFMLQNMFPQKG